MNLFLFMFILLVSFIIVRIGAVAFELTGLEWSLAKFQALSCFTGTGFTTKEAELITGNPQRRRIASVIMVLGNAGLVTLIATFANTLRPDNLVHKFTIPFLKVVFPSSLLPWINLLIIIIVTYFGYKFFTRSKLGKGLTDAIRARILKSELVKAVSFEELLVATGGYGISGIRICKNSPILDKTILEADLRKYDITILTVEREGGIIPNPKADTKIFIDDRLICFGKLDNIRNKLCPKE